MFNNNCVIGSHDSATYYLDKTGGFSPDGAESTLRNLHAGLGSILTNIIYNWSVTQTLNIAAQLDAGIRYFDLRVAVKPGDKKFYLVHGLYSVLLETCLKDINAFLNTHPNEVVLLDFNHLYNFTPEAHEECLSLIASIFENKLCPHLDPSTTSISLLNENGLQVIAFYCNPDVCKMHAEVWPGTLIPSPWANTTSIEKLRHFLDANYEKYRNRGADQFLVTQCVLTPDIGYIMSHLLNNLKDNMAIPASQTLTNWLKNKKAGPGGLNVCIIDFVEYCGYPSIIVNLNK